MKEGHSRKARRPKRSTSSLVESFTILRFSSKASSKRFNSRGKERRKIYKSFIKPNCRRLRTRDCMKPWSKIKNSKIYQPHSNPKPTDSTTSSPAKRGISKPSTISLTNKRKSM